MQKPAPFFYAKKSTKYCEAHISSFLCPTKIHNKIPISSSTFLAYFNITQYPVTQNYHIVTIFSIKTCPLQVPTVVKKKPSTRSLYLHTQCYSAKSFPRSSVHVEQPEPVSSLLDDANKHPSKDVPKKGEVDCGLISYPSALHNLW